jgi:hypothetical protein
MNVMSTNARDPRVLAEEIRNLAAQAYRALHDPLTDARGTRELSRRIADLQGVIDGLASDDLALWLENLRRRVAAPANRAALGSNRRRPMPSPSE